MCIVCGSGSAHLLRAIARRNAPRPRLSADAVAPLIVPALDPADDGDLVGPADVILRGGPIITMNAAAPDADAIALRAGRIQAVGGAADVFAHRGRLTRVIDLDGRALLPGFVNAHWHMPFTLLCEWVAAGAGETAEAALVRAVRQTPPGEWIVLGVAGASPFAAGTLDATAPSHPVVVTDPDGNVLAGSSRASPHPPHMSGLLGRFPITPDSIRRRFAKLLRQTAATGVTCLRVCGLGTLAGTEDLALMRAVMAEAPPLRLRATLDAALLLEWTALGLAPGFGDDVCRVDTLSAWPGDAAALQAKDWHVVLHAINSDQVQTALDRFAAAGIACDIRSGLECRSLPERSQLAILQRLGLSLGFTYSERDPLLLIGDLPSPPLSLGLDMPVGPSPPLRMLADARSAGLSLERSLAAVTIDAAKRCGVDDILGSLGRGKYADVAFLDADPRTAADPRCCGTWVNGREIRA